MKKKTVNNIGIGILSILFWYFFAVTITEVLITFASAFLGEIGSTLFLTIQILAILISYRIILDKRVRLLSVQQKERALARTIFLAGSLMIIVYFSINSFL